MKRRPVLATAVLATLVVAAQGPGVVPAAAMPSLDPPRIRASGLSPPTGRYAVGKLLVTLRNRGRTALVTHVVATIVRDTQQVQVAETAIAVPSSSSVVAALPRAAREQSGPASDAASAP